MSEDRKYGGGERRPLPPPPTWEQVLERNSIERLKQEKPPVRILEELDALGSSHYLDVSEEDIVRLKWYGLYHDKPKVGSFMLRIKVPGGLLPPESLRAVGELSIRYGQGFAELSTRQNVQLHFISLPDVPAILDRLGEAGLTTAGGCGDAVRNITGCPLEGVLADEAFDATPVVEEAANFFYGHPEYMDLPRKHKITISACPSQCDMPEINCVGLIGVVRDGVDGFAVRVGGGLSTVPRIARDLGVFVPKDEAVEVLRATLDVWKGDLRYRLSRVKARMKFMVDDYGADGMRARIEARLGRRLADFEAPPSAGFADHMGVHEQKQAGVFHAGVPVPVGVITGEQMVQVADLAASVGGDVRLTKQQNFVMTGIPEGRLSEATDRLAEIGFPMDANPLRATAIACTGEPHCNLRRHRDQGQDAAAPDPPGGPVGHAPRELPGEPRRMPARVRAALGGRRRADGDDGPGGGPGGGGAGSVGAAAARRGAGHLPGDRLGGGPGRGSRRAVGAGRGAAGAFPRDRPGPLGAWSGRRAGPHGDLAGDPAGEAPGRGPGRPERGPGRAARPAGGHGPDGGLGSRGVAVTLAAGDLEMRLALDRAGIRLRSLNVGGGGVGE